MFVIKGPHAGWYLRPICVNIPPLSSFGKSKGGSGIVVQLVLSACLHLPTVQVSNRRVNCTSYKSVPK